MDVYVNTCSPLENNLDYYSTGLILVAFKQKLEGPLGDYWILLFNA